MERQKRSIEPFESEPFNKRIKKSNTERREKTDCNNSAEQSLLEHSDHQKRRNKRRGCREEISSSEEEKFDCDQCPKIFTSSYFHQLHKASHRVPPTRLNCPLCDLELWSQLKLEHHLFDEHQTRRERRVVAGLTCTFCTAGFHSALDQVLHSLDCSAKPAKQLSFACTACSRTFTAARFLEHHLLTCNATAVDNDGFQERRKIESSIEEEHQLIQHREAYHCNTGLDGEIQHFLELSHTEFGKLKVSSEDCLEAAKRNKDCVVRLKPIDDVLDPIEQVESDRGSEKGVDCVDAGEVCDTSIVSEIAKNQEEAATANDNEIEIFSLGSQQPGYLVEYIQPTDDSLDSDQITVNAIPEYVIVNTIFEEERVCLPAVPDTYDDIAVGNTGDVVDDVAAMLEQKQKLLDDMLYKMIEQDGCPAVGDFSNLFGLTSQHILDLDIPDIIKTGEEGLAKGLLVDLLHLNSVHNLDNTHLARYLYEMLPGSARPEPDALTLENARKVVDRILKVKIQASRFRAKYNQFPKYLNKFLLEKINPFAW